MFLFFNNIVMLYEEKYKEWTKVHWTKPFEETDLYVRYEEWYLILIKRNRLWALCWYVWVPKDHPLFWIEYGSGQIKEELHNVHWWLTYSWYGIWPEVDFWEDFRLFGFDTAHIFDVYPTNILLPSRGGTYRDMEYVKKEVYKLKGYLKEN